MTRAFFVFSALSGVSLVHERPREAANHSHSIISQLLKLLFLRAPAHLSRFNTVRRTAEKGRWRAIDPD
jgi:hypothetical protein